MTPPNGKQQASPTPEKPITPPTKSGWKRGLTARDLDILRQGLTVVQPAEAPPKNVQPRPIRVSPVEFARLAALLAQQYGRLTPPQRYFQAADELIRLADDYLNRDRARVLGKRVIELEKDLNDGWVAIDVARQITNKVPDEKKGASQLGNLSTREGLIKAMQRLYGEAYEDFVERRTFRINGKEVQADAIHQTTIDRILEDQRQANQRRGRRKLDVSKTK